jgi:hypothetical protein
MGACASQPTGPEGIDGIEVGAGGRSSSVAANRMTGVKSAAAEGTCSDQVAGCSRISPELSLYLEAYERRLVEYAGVMRSHYNNKHAFVVSALAGHVNNVLLEEGFQKCALKHGDCDFCMVSLVRLLYLSRNASPALSADQMQDLSRAVRRIQEGFEAFDDSYWPHTGRPYPDSIVFWSENHILMLLSSSYLYRQWRFQNIETSRTDTVSHLPYIPTTTAAVLELKLLKVYLDTRATHGMFEVLSHVYLPHSLSALFNLYDFAEDPEIKQYAYQVIGRIIQQLLFCTTDTGVATLSASCRSFLRTRLRTHGHNVNQLIRLLIGVSPDEFGPNSLTDFLLTTSWRPNDAVLQDYFVEGFIRKQMNPSLEMLETVFNVDKCGLPEKEMTPFFWSAGLVGDVD